MKLKKTVASVFLALVFTAAMFGTAGAAGQREEAAYQKVQVFLSEARPSRSVMTPEGEFVTVFNPEVAAWVAQEFTPAVVKGIREKLAPSLEIEITAKGFASAASRDAAGAKDETNYDAVWVRDSAWIFYALLETPKTHPDARRLILALWDYYSEKRQVARFDDIICRPENTADSMKVPHIRFDGNSKSMDDVYEKGKPQEWNHRQNDAHGLFLIALADAIGKGLVKAEDLTDARFQALMRFPAYFDAIGFERFEDAGAWEEIDRRNTSSIGLVTGALKHWKAVGRSIWKDTNEAKFRDAFADRLMKVNSIIPCCTTQNPGVDCKVRAAWTEGGLDGLIERGMGTVKRQLLLGGESPDYNPDDIRFRRADAYLLSLMVPSPLDGLSEAEMRQALQIVETLKRPAGILRYANDSYQSGNFWIAKPGTGEKGRDGTETGDTSSKNAFLARFSGLLPDTEAQWFFDSLVVLARLHLASTTKDPVQKKQDVFLAGIHLKRALGQLTGSFDQAGLVDAQGTKVRPMLLPESINTVVVDGKRALLPSPIVPLNWSKAALKMALARYEKALAQGGDK